MEVTKNVPETPWGFVWLVFCLFLFNFGTTHVGHTGNIICILVTGWKEIMCSSLWYRENLK